MPSLPRIRFVTFDALYTLIIPRRPIQVQYAETFSPYLGDLPPESIKASFKKALREVQVERPSYRESGQSTGDSNAWWAQVIQRTAVGAGADAGAVQTHLHEIVPRLMHRFSSSEGYAWNEGALSVLEHLNRSHIRTAVVSNGDSRLRSVFASLEAPALDPIVLSEEEGIEKPDPRIFWRALPHDVDAKACVHVGDEVECDYHGAQRAGMHALILRRHDSDEDYSEVEEGAMCDSLKDVARRIDQINLY